MKAPILRLALSLLSPVDTFPARLKDVLEAHPGNTPVEVEASAPEWGPFDLRFGERFNVKPSRKLFVELANLEGLDVLEFPPVGPMTSEEEAEFGLDAIFQRCGVDTVKIWREVSERIDAESVSAPPAEPVEAAPDVPALKPASLPAAPPVASERRFQAVPEDVERHALALAPKAPGWRLQAIHEYTRADGSPWWWIARWRNSTTGEKQPRPFHFDGVRFDSKMPPIPHGKRPLYCLHKLEQKRADLVYLVEGERCADCLEAMGVLATTWPNGAQSVKAADWSPLAGRMVVLWPDNDAPGFEAMRTIRDTLERLGAVTLVVDVEKLALPPKGDCVDWLRRFLEQHGARRVSDLPGGRDLVAEALANLPTIDGLEAVA